MADFTMPKLGADMKDGLLSEWLVGPGDTVNRGDIVAVVETDKGAIEVEIFEAGTISELLVPEGERAAVGAVLARLGTSGAVQSAAVEPEPEPLVEPVVEPDPEPVVEPEPEPEPENLAEPAPVVAPPTAAPLPAAHGRLRAAPAARHLAHSLGIDLSEVTGTGPHGAVTTRDIRALVAAGGGRKPEGPPVEAAPVSAQVISPAPEGSTRTSSRGFDPNAMRSAIAAAMSRSKREIPHYYLGHDVELGAAMAWLDRQNADRPLDQRIHLSALLVKAVAKALKKVPELNGFWLDGGFEPATAAHVGFAISLRGGGLVAPAIVDAQDLSVEEVQARLTDLVERSRTGRLSGLEMSSPTITITSLGDLGVNVVYGVITPPQVALVGFGRPKEKVVAVAGMVAVRPVITATLAADHRASDGARGARFLSLVDRYLNKPEKL